MSLTAKGRATPTNRRHPPVRDPRGRLLRAAVAVPSQHEPRPFYTRRGPRLYAPYVLGRTSHERRTRTAGMFARAGFLPLVKPGTVSHSYMVPPSLGTGAGVAGVRYDRCGLPSGLLSPAGSAA